MEKQLQEARESVNPGWWAILDQFVPQILAVAPDAEIEVKEKFGRLRVWAGSETVDQTAFYEIMDAAETASAKTCECCGEPGQLRTKRRWMQTLCDRCDQLDAPERYRISQELAAKLT